MKSKILEKLQTQFLGKNIIYLKNIDSTQTYAKSLKTEQLPNGTVIIAESQTDGIGTHERKWYTGRNKNIAMTFVLYPTCCLSTFSDITITIAQCMIKAIEKQYGCRLAIKKPNDIVYQNKKIAGILTETLVEGEMVKRLLVGIGLNANQMFFPSDLKHIASSLKKEFGKEVNREEIIAEFLNLFEKEYLKIYLAKV